MKKDRWTFLLENQVIIMKWMMDQGRGVHERSLPLWDIHKQIKDTEEYLSTFTAPKQ